jgi:hypothetical protein
MENLINLVKLVGYFSLFSHAGHHYLVPLLVSGQTKGLSAELTGIWLLESMRSDVVFHIAQFWRFVRTQLALDHLIIPVRFRIQNFYNSVHLLGMSWSFADPPGGFAHVLFPFLCFADHV